MFSVPRWTVLGLVCLHTLPLAAQQLQTPAILNLATGTRVAGMNGAGVALVGDAGAVFENPAGLATIRHIALEGSMRPVSDGGTLGAAALGWRLGQFDLGFGGRLLRYGSQAGERPWDGLAVGSLVYRFGILAVGASGKYVRRELGTVRTYGVGGDIGVAMAVFDIMALGFAVQNVGGNWQDTSSLAFPRRTRLGFTMNYTDPQETYRLRSTLELQWFEGRPARGVIGVEGGVVVRGVGILGRAGYAGRSDAVTSTRLTVGATLSFEWLDLDYARRPLEPGGTAAHLFGVRLRL